MVDFDYLNDLSHNTSMLEVLEFYELDYINTAPNRYKILCPFHNDHDPSLVIYVHENHRQESFYCYACNIGGDPFFFIRQMEGEFQQAWTVLCLINKIEGSGELDQLNKILRVSSSREEVRSINRINIQISLMYKQLYQKLDMQKKAHYTVLIDKRFKLLDKYLTSNPSYSSLHQYFKEELSYFKQLSNT